MLNYSYASSMKAVGFLVGLALLLGATAPVSAQTGSTQQLQAQIQQLQAVISQLQAQIAALGGTPSTVCPFTWTRNLTIGARGPDVLRLQQFLNLNPATRVATAGAGAPRFETQYYGPLTANAVSRFQALYRAEVLTPIGLVNPTPNFGPMSRAKANQLCATVTPPPTPPGDDDDDDNGLEGGAGDVVIDQISSGVDDEVVEGEEEVNVLGFDLEADGSDVRVTSVRVEFEHDGSGSDRLDRYVDEVVIMLDGEEVGSADVDDFSESSDVYSENIALSGAVIREGDEGRFHIAVTAVNNVDSNDLSEDWEVALGQVRFVDATGAILTDTTGTGVNGTITETFTFEDLASAGNLELTVLEDDDDINNARTVQIDDTSDTNDVEILSFLIEAEGSDMTLESMSFDITSSGAGVTEIANDFRLLMDGEEVGDVSIDGGSFASSTDTTRTVTFSNLDDDDVIIEEGDEVSFILVADINDLDGAFASGDSFTSVTLDSADIDAEDENGDAVTDLNGSAQSDNISFAASGITADMVSTSATQVLGTDVSTDDQGRFIIEFEVTAFDDTAWVELTAASSTDAAGDNLGVAYSMENASTGATVMTGTSNAILERVSGGSLSGNFVRINAGQTATFRLTVHYDAATTGFYRVQMNEIGFNQASAADADEAYEVVPESEFQSTSVQVQN